jgi:hypothetical protein
MSKAACPEIKEPETVPSGPMGGGYRERLATPSLEELQLFSTGINKKKVPKVRQRYICSI